MDLRNLKREKGITLIALAVTIVVLLILAGVTISAVFSENGIIKKAQQAQTAIDKAKENDLAEIQNLVDEMNKYESGKQNINEADYETLTLKTYVGRFQRQCVNYLRAYVEIYDLENEEDSIIFNIGTDWDKHIDTTNDTNNLFLVDSSTNLKMVQNVENIYSSECNEETKIIDRNLLTAFTDAEITFKAKKDKTYGVKVVVQGANLPGTASGQDVVVDNISIINREIYKGEWGENIKRVITRDDAYSYGSNSLYLIHGDACTASDAIIISLIPLGKGGYEEYSYQLSEDSSKYALKVLNKNGDGAIDERYIGYDFNRDGYIDDYEEECIHKRVFSFSEIW